jgi:hypothetical protein
MVDIAIGFCRVRPMEVDASIMDMVRAAASQPARAA